jgi:hypothetical protein
VSRSIPPITGIFHVTLDNFVMGAGSAQRQFIDASKRFRGKGFDELTDNYGHKLIKLWQPAAADGLTMAQPSWITQSRFGRLSRR